MSKNRRIVLFNAIVIIGTILDQLSKAWAREALAAGPITFIPGVLDLRLVMNTGAAFSIGEGSTWIFIILALCIVGACEVWVVREQHMPKALLCSLAAVASGGVGNLIDRVIAGKVTDFFATTFINFPVFNVADIFVTCGVVAALIVIWHWDSERETSQSATSGQGE